MDEKNNNELFLSEEEQLIDVKNDNEIILQEEKAKGLWNPKRFIIISACFSFLYAAILYSLNYGRAGYKKKRNISLLLSLIGFVLFVFSVILLPNIIQIGLPNTMPKCAGLAVNIGIGVCLKCKQQKLFKEHIDNGGKKASYLGPILVSTIISVGWFCYIIQFAAIPDNKILIKGDEVYYTDKVKIEVAQKVGQALEDLKWIDDDGVKTSVKVDIEYGINSVSLCIVEESLEKKGIMKDFREMGEYISNEVFEGKEVEVHLCDEFLKTKKIITTKIAANKIVVKGDAVYYTDDIKLEEVEETEKILRESGWLLDDGITVSVKLEKENDVIIFSVIILDEFLDNKEIITESNVMSGALSSKVFKGKDVEIHLCDEYFKPKNKIKLEIPTNKVEIKGDEVFFTDNVKEEQAKRLAEFLFKVEYFLEDEKRVSVKLDQKNGVYIISLIIQKEYLDNPEILIGIRQMSERFSYEIFNGETVEVHLCDEYFKFIKNIKQEEFKRMQLASLYCYCFLLL